MHTSLLSSSSLSFLTPEFLAEAATAASHLRHLAQSLGAPYTARRASQIKAQMTSWALALGVAVVDDIDGDIASIRFLACGRRLHLPVNLIDLDALASNPLIIQ